MPETSTMDLKLTPQPKRSAMYAIYAWMRTADDLADQPGAPEEKTEKLEMFRRQTIAAIESDDFLPSTRESGYELIWPAVRKAALEFQIPRIYLETMIDGQLRDQQPQRYDTFEHLYQYCYQVASVVGLVCITIWGYDGKLETQKLAEYRGVGLQLTNILRDLVEDAQRGRVYIPAVDLERHGYDPETFAAQLIRGDVGPAFESFMAEQIIRARHYYDESADLESHLDPSCRPTSRSIAQIYRRLLEKIARHPRRVLNRTVHLRMPVKLGIALRAVWTKGLIR